MKKKMEEKTKGINRICDFCKNPYLDDVITKEDIIMSVCPECIKGLYSLLSKKSLIRESEKKS